MTGIDVSNRTSVLVTGAAGRLGSTVADVVHRAGYDLLATDVVDAGDVPYRFEQADLLDHVRVLELLDGVDAVVHLGNHAGIGATPPQRVFNNNVSMNENVFQGAAEQSVGKIIFASTLQMIGSHIDRRTVINEPATPSYPLDETMTPDPSNVYALSKTVSEVMLRYYADRCGIDCVAVRFPMLHRGDDWARVSAGEETAIDILEGFTALTHDDAAELILGVLGADLPGYRVYMPGVAHRHRDLDPAELICAYYPGIADGTDELIDISTIVDQIGWQPSPVHHWSSRA